MSTAVADAGPRSDRTDGRWHYRRSLASRVILLTTIAVGLAVALVSRRRLRHRRGCRCRTSLDESLIDRAARPPRPTSCSRRPTIDIPSWALGAADVRIALFAPTSAGVALDRAAAPICARRARSSRSRAARRDSQHPHDPPSTASSYRVVAVPTAGAGAAPW